MALVAEERFGGGALAAGWGVSSVFPMCTGVAGTAAAAAANKKMTGEIPLF